MRLALFAAGLSIGLSGAVTTAAAQRGFVQPTCDVNKGHYLISSAVLYLQNAGRTRFPDQRTRDLRDAHRVLIEAITEKGQDQNGSAWYYLGRYYQEVHDLPGADSAFDRAQRMLPGCAKDIRSNRRRLWVPILNGAVDRIRAGDNDGAIEELQQANAIYSAEPPAFYYLGQIYANQETRDSAVKYYAKALALAQDSTNASDQQYQDIRDNAAFNIARLYHIGEQYDSAAAWYRRFLADDPGDPEALTGLASALQAAGHADQAIAIYDTVLVRADSMPTLDLFQAGVAMFRAGRLQRASEAFQRGLTRNPNYRDALYNLANTYLSLANEVDSTKPEAEQERQRKEYGAKMTPIVHRLLAIDPANSQVQRLLAASYQLEGLSDSTLAVLERRDAMPFEVTVSTFEPSGSGYDVRGLITNLKSDSTTVPSLRFDFLNEQGEVVQSITVEQQTLEADGIVPFALAPVGEGIAAWRYTVGSASGS